jgi:hypothetical protein
MASVDAELAFLDELAVEAGIVVEEKKEEADEKGSEHPGSIIMVAVYVWQCPSASGVRAGHAAF